MAEVTERNQFTEIKGLEGLQALYLVDNQITGTIYDDGQNVHDSKINESIQDSLWRLLDDSKGNWMKMTDQTLVYQITTDTVLDETSKQLLLEYSENPDTHSLLGVTFKEALKCIWQIITEHKDSVAIKGVLMDEIKDSLCKCFTGRLSRLVNCLNGFDERVVVHISESSEISALILSIRKRHGSMGVVDGVDGANKIRNEVRQEMTSRGYSQQMIEEWLGYLD